MFLAGSAAPEMDRAPLRRVCLPWVVQKSSFSRTGVPAASAQYSPRRSRSVVPLRGFRDWWRAAPCWPPCHEKRSTLFLPENPRQGRTPLAVGARGPQEHQEIPYSLTRGVGVAPFQTLLSLFPELRSEQRCPSSPASIATASCAFLTPVTS